MGAGRHPHPSAAILDSQSVKTTKKDVLWFASRFLREVINMGGAG
jgi:hypothetical protein